MLTSSLTGTSAGTGTTSAAVDVDLSSQWFSNCSTSGYDERQALLAVWFRVWSGAERLMCLVTLLDTMTHAEMICLRNIIQLRLQHKTSAVIQEANANTVDFVNDGVSNIEAPSADKTQQQQPLLMITKSTSPESRTAGAGGDCVPEQLTPRADCALRRSSYTCSCVHFLLENMPLLSPSSHECRRVYMLACVTAAEAVLAAGAAGFGVESEQLEGVRQLLALLAVHPALTRDDRCVLSELYSRFGTLYTSADAAGNSNDTNSNNNSPCTAALSIASLTTPAEECDPQSHLAASCVNTAASGGLTRRRHSACAAIGSRGWMTTLETTHEEMRQGLVRRGSAVFGAPSAVVGRKNLLSPYDAEEAGGESRFCQLRANSLTPPSATSSPGSDRSLLAPPSPRQAPSVLPARSCSVASEFKQLSQRPSYFPNNVSRANGDDSISNPLVSVQHPRRSEPTPRPHTPPHRSSSHSNLSDISRDRAFSTRGSGMTTVPKWLHKLRLHKYTWLFASLSYRQMLDVSIDWLLQLGVTQGAANKLVRSINQLQHIRRHLAELHQGLIDGSISLYSCLESMEVIVVSPMLPTTHQQQSTTTESTATLPNYSITNTMGAEISGSNPASTEHSEYPIKYNPQQQQREEEIGDVLPDTQTLCTQVLGRLCTKLLMVYVGACGMVENGGVAGGDEREDVVQRVLRLLDEATWQEAFSDAQRRKFVTWKRQIAAELGRHTTVPPVYPDSRSSFFSQRRYSDVHIGAGPRRFSGAAGPNYRERPGLLPIPLMNGPSMVPWTHHNTNNNNNKNNCASSSFGRQRARVPRGGGASVSIQAPVRSMSGSLGLAPSGSSGLAPRSLVGGSRRTSLQEGIMASPVDTWGRASAFTRPPPAVDFYRHQTPPLTHHHIHGGAAPPSHPPPPPPPPSSSISSSSSSVMVPAVQDQSDGFPPRNTTDIPYICRSVFDNVIS